MDFSFLLLDILHFLPGGFVQEPPKGRKNIQPWMVWQAGIAEGHGPIWRGCPHVSYLLCHGLSLSEDVDGERAIVLIAAPADADPVTLVLHG